jgi:predicted nucleic acid-binding protein
VIYLLDVNALIAAGYAQHLFHSRMAAWIERDHPESIPGSYLIN